MESERVRRVRRTLPCLDEYVEDARQELQPKEDEDAAVDSLNVEQYLNRVKHK